MAAAAGAEPLPKFLQKTANSLSGEDDVKLRALLEKYKFDADMVDIFEINKKCVLRADSLEAFAAYLAEDASSKLQAAQQKAKVQPPKLITKTNQRKRSLPAMQLPSGVRSMVGLDAVQDIGTPATKKQREDGANPTTTAVVAAAPVAAIDPPSKQLAFAVKPLLNGTREKPTRQGAPAKRTVLGDSALSSGKRAGAYEWMDESIEERTAAIDAHLASMETDVTASMCEQLTGDDVAVGTIGVPAQAEVILCGRIACEGLEGKLNERSILLDGSWASSRSASVRLTVAECPTLATFPGQVVGVRGRSGASSATFHARELVSGLPVPPRSPSRGDAPIHMVVAAGPYCLRAGLDYSPLENILDYAERQRPDVLVLLGPFVEAANQRVVAGDTVLPGDTDPCDLEEVYIDHVVKMLEHRIAPLRRGPRPITDVIIMPSLDEALCFHPLPQPPLDASLNAEGAPLDKLKRLGAQMLPNPAHISIGGLRMSLASADALSPLLKDIVLRPEGRKIEESLRQILRQRTLFPVLPREPAQVSESRASALSFPDGVVPDVCIFPSVCGGMSGIFVDDTAFVNPGSVCKPAALGGFTEMWVNSPGSTALPFSERVIVNSVKLS